jgi:sugar phosphate isomerase/epimerase
MDFVKSNGIKIVRRTTGGGSVYHDLGNINFSVIKKYGGNITDAGELTEPIVSFLQSIGIPVRACNNFFPASIRLTGEDINQTAIMEYVRRAADRALKMGAEIIVYGSSGAKNIPAGFPHGHAKQQLIEILHGIDDIITPLGITVALEPINAEESNFILSVKEGISVVNETNRGSIRLLADYYHMKKENEEFDVLAKAEKMLSHVHISSIEGRSFPRHGDGEGYGAFFKALEGIGYDACISIEAFSDDALADGRAALELLRTYIPQSSRLADDFVTV